MKDCGQMKVSQVKNKIRSITYLVYRLLFKNFLDFDQIIELVSYN